MFPLSGCDGVHHFAECLTFSSRSSPKVFDSLSEALCCILANIYRLLNWLDRFLVITPSSRLRLRLTTLTKAFSELLSLSKEKTAGHRTSIEFLGFTLDSISFQPSEKVQRNLSNYLLADSCTKHQLLPSLTDTCRMAARFWSRASGQLPQQPDCASHKSSVASRIRSGLLLRHSRQAHAQLHLNPLALSGACSLLDHPPPPVLVFISIGPTHQTVAVQ